MNENLFFSGRKHHSHSKLRKNILKYIKSNPTLISTILLQYGEFYVNIKPKIKIYDLCEEYELVASSLQMKYRLLPSDASIVATMIQNNVSTILTDDEDLKKVHEIVTISL